MKRFLAVIAAFLFIFLTFNPAYCHCDTLDGPVVKDARKALEKGDVTPALKWVKKNDEVLIRSAFKAALADRAKGPEAKEKADLKFFEMLVRLHRVGEGGSFTGLKPSGSAEPIVAEADKALEKGSADKLTAAISKHVASGIKERFERVKAKAKKKDRSVSQGRAYVAAYVEYMHYLDGVYKAVAGEAEHKE